jgi:3-isopropylmalate/(R)-2-methylmalate dehydratase small subunit
MDYGFAAIVAPSFGDIFRNNSSKQGLVIVHLAQEDVDELTRIVKEDSTRLVLIDVDQMVVEVPETDWQRSFALDPLIRERLLNGWDDIGLTMRREASITAYEARSDAPTLEGVFDDAGHVVAH